MEVPAVWSYLDSENGRVRPGGLSQVQEPVLESSAPHIWIYGDGEAASIQKRQKQYIIRLN